MSDDEVVEMLQELPTIRLLRALRGFSHILVEIANGEEIISDTNKQDLLWTADRLRLLVIVLEQHWVAEEGGED